MLAPTGDFVGQLNQRARAHRLAHTPPATDAEAVDTKNRYSVCTVRTWEDLSAVDRRGLTEMLVDKIIIERHPSKIDKDGRRHYLIRAIPYQDPQQEAERLKAVHEARVKIVPRV
jgi:hypothetical protein